MVAWYNGGNRRSDMTEMLKGMVDKGFDRIWFGHAQEAVVECGNITLYLRKWPWAISGWVKIAGRYAEVVGTPVNVTRSVEALYERVKRAELEKQIDAIRVEGI
jgi:hypothetical protein